MLEPYYYIYYYTFSSKLEIWQNLTEIVVDGQ